MASSQEFLPPELLRCYHCGVESTKSSFKYFDNKKVDQPRFKCHHCHKFFTLGLHGRPQGKTYAKKRNEDPPELKTLSRQCRHCGVADNALFKYYNNNSLLQPRFRCLSCKEQFQMRVLGTGGERRLVHTSSQQRSAPRRRKQGVPERLPNTFNSAEEDNCEANFTSWTSMGDTDPELPPLSSEDAQFLDMLEAEISAEESNEAPIDDAFSSTANGTLALESSPTAAFSEPWTWTQNDIDTSVNSYSMSYADAAAACCRQMDLDRAVEKNFMQTSSLNSDSTIAFADSFCIFPERVSESTCDNIEVMYGTAASGSGPWTSWTPENDDCTSVDSYSESYAEAAAACCRQMDLDMAVQKNSMDQTAPWTF